MEWCKGLTEEQVFEALAKFAKHPGLRAESAVLSHLIERSLATGHFADAPAMAERLDAKNRELFLNQLARECPEAMRSEAFKWYATTGNEGALWQLISHASECGILADGREYRNTRWLSEMLETHPETRDFLVESGIYRNFMRSEWARLPMEEGVAAMVANDPSSLPEDEKRSKALGYFCEETVSRLLPERAVIASILSDPEATSGGVDAVIARMGPEAAALYAANPDQTRAAIFLRLSAFQPEKAAVVLDGLEPGAREDLLLRAAQPIRWAAGGDAGSLLALMQSCPIPEGAGREQARFNVWTGVSPIYYSTYGDAYPEWLLSLPPSPDRNIALSAMAMTVYSTDPDLSSRLKAAQTPKAATK